MSNCMFYFSEGHCKILQEQKCEYCKFRKTEQQFNNGQKYADEILAAKGLQRYLFSKNGIQYVSVRRIKK